jgi:hypothetical protein
MYKAKFEISDFKNLNSLKRLLDILFLFIFKNSKKID